MGETKFELLHDIPAHETFIWWLEVKENICVTAGKEGQVVGKYQTFHRDMSRL